ncbi:hypothetical protein JWG42_11845 [Desulfoprunum benzoelyticum]|uniref:Phosphoenolpyruvate synthase n=1 Tax=Desulfoprunum benzoelyticum TaxID=1506996 RepID=A0A840UWM3_9BACT|nr:PEP/pyruvate-binding domain-containing protein [Desulfoprunum benzoelyticum]MBB5349226.1 pyruvate,water dikinase [Desulfoprunum benzoelyticum]MBM9530843.1 hypothetical protein [Desulfoprunum benzoelyticum]
MQLNTLFKYWTYRLFAPGVVLRETYEAFRELLVFDNRSHELMADLEVLYYQGIKEDLCRIGHRYDALSDSVNGMITCLERMAPGSFVTLREYYRKFDFYGRFLLAPPTVRFGPPFALPLDAAAAQKPEMVGAKTANLAAIAASLQLPIPAGFAITVNSFNYLLEYNDLRGAINALLARIEPTVPDSLADISSQLTELITSAEVPPAVHEAIFTAQAAAFADREDRISMVVRSSAVGEDSEFSFAGQYATVLDVRRDNLITAYLTVLASKYQPEALAYRIHTGFGDEETPMAVMVLEMIDATASGVIYTVGPTLPGADQVHIHTVRGLGEGLVSGRLIPEIIAVDRDALQIHTPTTDDDRVESERPPALRQEQAVSLATRALEIEEHFGSPQDIEWVMRENGELFFLQSRPLSTHPRPSEAPATGEPAESRDDDRHPLLQGGTMAAAGQASGPAYCVDRDHPVEQVPAGSILVIREASPAYVQVIDRVVGVLAELGSVAGHFATICREFEVPLLCGLGSGIQTIRHGQTISMQAAERRVFDGATLSTRPPIPLYHSQSRLPYFRKLRRLLDTITPLHLTDPRAGNFIPEECRSFHDMIRFCHEQAVRTMFSLGDRLGQPARNRKKILSDLPFDIFVVDVGGGLESTVPAGEAIPIGEIASAPFLALWSGITHPSVHWQDLPHFDWRQFSETTLGDGISTADSPEYASYAVLGGDYVNLIMRFGYHFTLIDALCGDNSANNYCQFRFAGGGGEFSGRLLRLQLISTVLEQAGFQIETRGDLLDARISALPAADMQAPLQILGRLLGATRLMDMTLHDIDDVHRYIENFLAESPEGMPS